MTTAASTGSCVPMCDARVRLAPSRLHRSAGGRGNAIPVLLENMVVHHCPARWCSRCAWLLGASSQAAVAVSSSTATADTSSPAPAGGRVADSHNHSRRALSKIIDAPPVHVCRRVHAASECSAKTKQLVVVGLLDSVAVHVSAAAQALLLRGGGNRSVGHVRAACWRCTHTHALVGGGPKNPGCVVVEEIRGVLNRIVGVLWKVTQTVDWGCAPGPNY